MAEYNKYIGNYERIPYSSFVWKFGTTSFRTREFNKMTEWQLQLLDDFWKKPQNRNQGWEKKYMAVGQKDIYEIKNRYYDWLVENGFTKGDDKVKYKAAREKTSGLYDMGLIDENHRLTNVGRELLELSKDENAFLHKNQLNISEDSQIYLEQLLKLSADDAGNTVRPFIVVLYLLSKLDYLSYDEFRYLMPLCTSEFNTEYILHSIESYRENGGSIDVIIQDFLMNKSNYQEGLNRFINEPFSEDLLLSVGMNRKSADYDKAYIPVYKEMYAVYMEKDYSRIYPLFLATNKLSTSIKWKTMMFNSSLTSVVKKAPLGSLLALPEEVLNSDASFKRFFYITMHLNKAKSMLEDYLNLNRRYLGLTNCFIFGDEQVRLDIVPKQFFNAAIDELYKQAYEECDLLFESCTMDSICPALTFNESKIIEGINKELGTQIENIEDAYDEVDKIRYDRFNKLIDAKFTDDILIKLLDNFDNRTDGEISQMVTDNADIPTIFEYVLGIIWYKSSGRRGRILDYLKLSLDANLLPVTHAAGGEADIVYEYKQTLDYPEHCLLLEATLADSTNQRRMEMEPVSRHLGNHLLRTGNENSYCVFATTYLHINVIGDFRMRKMIMYCDPQDTSKYVSNLKIMPLSTNDLRCIVEEKIPYSKLYKHFCEAHDSQEMHPQKWYDDYVNIENSNLSYMINEQSLQMAAEPFEIYNWNRFDKNIIDFFGGDKTILVGCYKDKKYLDWIQAHNLYNIRLGNTKGSMEENRALFKKTTLLLLYELNKPGKLSAYEICGHQEIGKDELLRMDYPNPKPRKSYMGFTIKPLDMDLSFVANQHLVEKLIKVSPNNAKGTPVFIEP
jgi:hypothetical protein